MALSLHAFIQRLFDFYKDPEETKPLRRNSDDSEQDFVDLGVHRFSKNMSTNGDFKYYITLGC